ncbi:MAG TPA: HAMP domain-containing protein, partial [Herpetosiphonaceae bacterium]|nr:HAMP domain-containing protein [Herpetosiphonaceae bacterium]
MRTRFRRMQWRIASAIIILILLIVAILSSIFLVMLRNRYLQALEVGLAGQARLIAALTPASGPLDDGVAAWLRQVHGHATLVGADGAVLVDEPPLLAPGTDMRNRPEIQDALQFGRGEATRASSSAATGQEMFYVAVPAPDSATVAVVRVGVPLTMVAEAQRQILHTVVVTASLASLGAVAIALVLARQITRPLHNLRTMATRLAGGELDVAVPLPTDEDLAALATDFNQMAQVLRHLITSRETERQRLATTVMTMADGLLMISAEEQVTSLNPAAERWLAAPPAAIPFPLSALPMGTALVQAVQRARATPPDQMPLVIDEVPLDGDPRSLRAVITVLPPPESDQALIVMQDMTTLRQAERGRRTLLANLSHDFRTPLASLRA